MPYDAARPSGSVGAATASAVPSVPPEDETPRQSRSLPPVGADAAIDRALSGAPMEAVLATAEPPGIIGRSLAWYGSQTPLVRRLIPVIAALLLFALIPVDSGNSTGAGVSVPRRTPETRIAAESLLAQTQSTATVEMIGEEVVVTYPILGFPTAESDRERLAVAYAAADAIVEGRRRTIYFYTPQGNVFAKSDSVVGVTLRQ